LIERKRNFFNKFKAAYHGYLNDQKTKGTILFICAIGFSSYSLPLIISEQAFAQVNQFNPNPNQNNGGFSQQQQPQQQPGNDTILSNQNNGSFNLQPQQQGTNSTNGTALELKSENKSNTVQPTQNQQPPPYQQPSNMNQYTDREGSFTMSYPNTWSVKPGVSEDVFFRDLSGTSLVSVMVLSTPPSLSPEILAHIWKNGMVEELLGRRIYTAIQDVECSKYKVEGNTACSSIVTTTPRISSPVTSIDVVTSINGKIYDFQLDSPQETFNSILPIFETMLHSFKAGSTSGGQPPAPSGLTPYQNPNLGVSIRYPSDWSVHIPEGYNESRVVFDSPLNENGSRVSFTIHVIPNRGTLQQYTTTELFYIRQHNWTMVTQPSQIQLSGSRGVFVMVKTQYGDIGAQMWTIQSGKVYILSYFAPDSTTWHNNLQTIGSIIRSFHILSGTSNGAGTFPEPATSGPG
jgi:photosystem II reaction center protein PsbP